MKQCITCLSRIAFVTCISMITSAFVYAGGKDDPLLAMVKVDQFEVRDHGDENPIILEADAWIGHDLQKLWLVADAEFSESEFEEAVFDVLYGHAIAPYWDARIGLRQTVEPQSNTWGVLSLKGLAPYYFDIDTSLAITQLEQNSSWQAHINVTAEYEVMITQRLFASPEFELNAYTRNDASQNIGSGLSNMNLGLRVGYEIRREFAPYIGINWSQKFGKTKDLANSSGSDTSDTQLLLGVSMWF